MHALDRDVMAEAYMDMPRELRKSTLSEYRVEPPDVLLIEAVNTYRPPDSALEPGDILTVKVKNGLPLDLPTFFPPTPPDPIGEDATNEEKAEYEKKVQEYTLQLSFSQSTVDRELELERAFKDVIGDYQIGPNGELDLGPVYGAIPVAGMSVAQAREAIHDYLTNTLGLKAPELSVTMVNFSGKQFISGEHLVRPDGKVNLGVYGQVDVAGLTLPEVRVALEEHLKQHINDPEVNVDVLAYNSKVYYVITDGGGFGEQVVRLPFTGNETVLDAISQIQGLSQVSSKKIWIARPAPSEAGYAQVLDVHWNAIAAEGITSTNYQLFPGDRIYIKADHLIATDNLMSKMLAPVERLFGIILLGTGVSRSIDFYNQFGRNTNSGSGTF